MANLTTYTFGQLVSNIATAIQGSARSLLDFTVGLSAARDRGSGFGCVPMASGHHFAVADSHARLHQCRLGPR